MKSLLELLAQRVRDAMARVGMDGDPLLRPAQEGRFGDYQSNCAMGLARKVGKKPREVATAICENLEVDDLCEPPQIAGPGFINLRLKPAYLARCLKAIPPACEGEDDRLGIEPTDSPQVVVVDLSSPNLAKEMHVGHLRSTVIGDCVSRILEFEGHTVLRENHVGDWGTQFGMLLAHLRSVRPEVLDKPNELLISDLESFYVEAKKRFDADEDFRTESRETVVALQKGDATTRRLWRAFCDESLRHCHAIYDRLGVRLIDRGESFYNDLMDEVVARLEKLMAQGGDGSVAISDGALCIFMDGFTTRENEPLPLMVRKTDGAYLYATSDLAAIIHRVEELKATRIVYVVGLPAKLHFDMVFSAARHVGWVGEEVSLEHLGFGHMLGADGLPFKTREGGTVKLKDLLDEAVARARKVIEDQQPGGTALEPIERQARKPAELTDEQIAEVAETVGLGAVKYFDLSHSLSGDYKFDLNTMVAMEGNTAPYMLYAYARVRSIGRKAGVDFAALPTGDPIALEHPLEVALALKLLRFAETIDAVGRELRPNILTDYLYELAKAFSRFYDRKLGVRVIDASPDSLRISRLRLCDLTARTLKLGLHLLGIDTVERM